MEVQRGRRVSGMGGGERWREGEDGEQETLQLHKAQRVRRAGPLGKRDEVWRYVFAACCKARVGPHSPRAF